jgi:hypothetical protein
MKFRSQPLLFIWIYESAQNLLQLRRKNSQFPYRTVRASKETYDFPLKGKLKPSAVARWESASGGQGLRAISSKKTPCAIVY